MKVGIITFHFVNNFGGALQAYALRRAVEQCGVETHVIDYRQWFIRFTDMVRMFPIAKNPKVIISGLKTMDLRVGRRRKFAKFQNEYLNLSDTYYTNRSLKQNSPGYDKYICGSDQIWNTFITCGICKAYFLDFVKDSKDKFSYAPSFGSVSITSKYSNSIQKYLNMLHDISVREKEGVSFVKELTGRDAIQLMDPTFLVDRQEWEMLADSVSVKLSFKEYILIYIMQKDDTIYECARDLKNQYNIPVVEIGRYGYRAPFVDECLVDLGPLEFINLFKNATYVCTNSYHGLIFSIIFRKKLRLIPCKRFKSRMESLTELLGFTMEDNEKPYVDVEYNTEYIEKIVSEKKCKSVEYIRRNIGIIND